MARKLKPATPDDVQSLRIAVVMIREAKKHFKAAGCKQTVRRINRVLDSADGAVRHMERRANQTLYQG